MSEDVPDTEIIQAANVGPKQPTTVIDPQQIQELKDIANRLRLHAIRSTQASKSGYMHRKTIEYNKMKIVYY